MNFSYIIDLLLTAISSCSDWLSDFFDSIPNSSIWFLSIFFILIVCRFIIAPFVGASMHAGLSDMVKGSKSKIKSNKKKGG